MNAPANLDNFSSAVSARGSKAGSSENTNTVALPVHKTKPPCMAPGAANREDREFGRQLSTNHNEAGGVLMLQVAPGSMHEKPNVSDPMATAIKRGGFLR